MAEKFGFCFDTIHSAKASRGIRSPYHDAEEWRAVERVTLDRVAAEDDGSYGARVAAFKPDVVIDLICFEMRTARQLVDASLTEPIGPPLPCKAEGRGEDWSDEQDAAFAVDGQSLLTRMPWGARSTASERASWATAPLVAL